MRRQILLLTFSLFFCTQSVHADELIFTNGDHLTGKIDHLVEGKMVFKSDILGEVKFDLSKIKTFSTDDPIAVHLKDETVLLQKITSSEPGKFGIEGAGTVKAQDFELASISSINPPVKPLPKWTGNISVGVTSTHGNTKSQSMSGSFNMSKRTHNDRTQVSMDYAKTKQEDKVTGVDEVTEDWWRSKGKYDYFFTKKLFGFVDGRYEKDAIAELDRRMIIGGGAGYQWVESPDLNFSTEFGMASLYEKFDNQTDSNSEISMQAGYNFDKTLMKNVKFIHELTYYPSTEKFSDYYLTSTGEIRANLTSTMFASFKAIFNYDVTPAIGSGSTDTKYLLGVGFNF
jgi:putative salt-induced outer membrane protein YdiY